MSTRKERADAIRVLSIDAIDKAKSGHPGAPLGMADFAEVLWSDFLKHNPADPQWPDRDRFVLSNGHASMLLYSLLHLTGYDLSIEDLKQFRQPGSKTPGHPEYGHTPGVETTTGPLGQGVANAVGMALAERMMAARFNRPDFPVVDHYTYATVGDGCLMEGISHEACSLAGTLRLGKLVVLYDDNGISIDGPVDGWFRDNTPKRFESYGWGVWSVDGHDAEAVRRAIAEARADASRPSLICCKTTIGCGAPNAAGKSNCHGSPLGSEEILNTRRTLGWANEEPFAVPEDVYRSFDARAKGAESEDAWRKLFDAYAKQYPELAAEFSRRTAGELPDGFDAGLEAILKEMAAQDKPVATRKASGMVLEKLVELLPELAGGSCDLSGSNNTKTKSSIAVTAENYGGNYIEYGVREFAMAAIMSGIALHKGFIPYGGTFLVFSDYMRSALRSASLMGIRSIFVLTHDSIGVGEDGPTHQPIEHLAALRVMPLLEVWRPADDLETAVAWGEALRRQGATCLALSRQGLPPLKADPSSRADMRRGGYVVYEPEGGIDAIAVASGSEVHLALEAAKELSKRGHKVRVVSMPCMDRFEAQDPAYQARVLPEAVTARLVIEAAAPYLWRCVAGPKGRVMSINRYGCSGPGKALFERFGFTVENAVRNVLEMLGDA
ncbi:MAG: transketolase [Desulfovibrionaceae bacterium]